MKILDSNIKIALQPSSRLMNVFTNTKEKTVILLEGACYVIPCDGDGRTKCDKLYIGETGRDPILDRIPEYEINYKKIY